jgi:hypothetical protein
LTEACRFRTPVCYLKMAKMNHASFAGTSETPGVQSHWLSVNRTAVNFFGDSKPMLTFRSLSPVNQLAEPAFSTCQIYPQASTINPFSNRH